MRSIMKQYLDMFRIVCAVNMLIYGIITIELSHLV